MAKIRWDGDAASAVRAQEALTTAMEKYAKETQKGTTNAKALEARARAIAEFANPQEKYNRKMRELAEAVNKGKVTMDQAHASAMRYGRELERAGDASKKAFSKEAIVDYVAGLVSIGTIVATISKAFGDAEEKANAAADAMLDALGAVGEMQQLGPEGMPRGLALQRQLIETGTVRRNQKALAADIATNMVNAGATKEQTDFVIGKLGGAGGKVKAENLDKVMGNLIGMMNQFGEADIADVSARLMAGANRTKANLSETATNVMKFGELAALSGMGMDQAIAGFATSEKTGASAESAAEMQKSFYSQVYKKQLGVDGDLVKTLQNITSKIPQGGTAFDVLGDANAVIGYGALMRDMQSGVLKTAMADIGGATAEKMFGPQSNQLANLSPGYAAVQNKVREEGRADAVMEEDAAWEANFDAIMAVRDARRHKAGMGPFRRALNRMTDSVDDWFGQEQLLMRLELDAYKRGVPNSMSPETAAAIEKQLGDQTGIMKTEQTRALQGGAVRPE